MDYNEWYYNQYLNNYYKKYKTNSTKPQENQEKSSKALECIPNMSKTTFLNSQQSFNNESYSQIQLDYYQNYVSKFHLKPWNQPPIYTHNQVYTEYDNQHIFYGHGIQNTYYHNRRNATNGIRFGFDRFKTQRFQPKHHNYRKYCNNQGGNFHSTETKRLISDKQLNSGKINVDKLTESNIEDDRFNEVILSLDSKSEIRDLDNLHNIEVLPETGVSDNKNDICSKNEFSPSFASTSSPKTDLSAKENSHCDSINHSPKVHDIFVSILSPGYSDSQNEIQNDDFLQNYKTKIEAVDNLEKINLNMGLESKPEAANLIDDSSCDLNIETNKTVKESSFDKDTPDNTLTSEVNAQKITIRLPFFQSLNEKTCFEETQSDINCCGIPIDNIESDKESSKIAKKVKLSKEELRMLKLARRETDCQVIYGAEEANIINLKSTKSNVSKPSNRPGFRNYITRHLINKISNCEPSKKLAEARRNVLSEVKNQKKGLYKLIENKKKNQDKNSSAIECSSPKKSFDRSDKLSVNLDILALDRWGIWCEAQIVQLESKRALIEYKDIMVHRKEWISLGKNRIKFLEEDTLITPIIDVEITDSPSLPIDSYSPVEILNSSSPNSPILNNYFSDFGNCSNCDSLFEQFRYYCLHCPDHDFAICKSCYLNRFPKKHKHSRLVFSKECIISFSNIDYYLKKPVLKDGNQLDKIQSMVQDKFYDRNELSIARQKTWSASLEARKIHRPGILGLHRFLPNSHFSFKPNLIMCIFCHSTQHTSLPQKGNIEFSGDFISLERPFILPPSSRNKSSKKAFFGKSTSYNASKDSSINYVDLFWCHINCAKFSSNVFVLPKVGTSKDSNLHNLSPLENFDFYNLSHAVRLGNRHRCPRCREKGATIACEKPGCVKHYHLQCTGKTLDFFERGQVFYCRSHETGIKKTLPLTNVIGSISCCKCGGLLPQGRKDNSVPTEDMSSTSTEKVSNSLESTNSAQIHNMSQLKPETTTISNENDDTKLIEKNELVDIETVHCSSENSNILPLIEPCLKAKETPDSSWSWYTCQECIASDKHGPFDLCQNCFKKDFDQMNHEHDRDQFRWTNYHDVANDSSREAYLFKLDDAIEYNTKRPNISKKQKLILYMNSRKRKEVPNDEPDQKEDTALQCAYCWDTSSKIWRKGYAGVLLCGKCFDGIPHEENPNSIEKSVKKKRKKITLKIQSRNKTDFNENNETSKEYSTTSQENQSVNITTESSNIKEPSNLVHQYSGEIEDYHHFPYYTRIICNEQNFDNNFSQAKFLDSYAPTESHWFSLLITSSYYDIPGRAPRWGSHSGSDYHGTWLPQTVRRALLRYTRPNEKILSNFLGRGTDAIECFLLKRKCFGVDINPVAISLSQKNCSFALPSGLGITAAHRPTILQGDSRDLRGLDNFDDNCFDHVLSHPPYKDCVSYSTNIDGDLSKFTNQEEFQSEMTKVIQENWRLKFYFSLLKMGGRLTLGIGDNREKCFYLPISFQLLRNYLENGFELEELIVKRQRHCQMFGLGTYLSAHYGFLIFTHEYIFTLKKVPKNKKLQQSYRKFLRNPEELIRWKFLVRIKRRRRAIPPCPVERQSVIMGTVWNFRPQAPHTFEMLCKSRMVERFGKNGANWLDIDLSFPKFKDELSDMKRPQDIVYDDSVDTFLSDYEKLRETKMKENSQKLLSLGLTVELGDERSEDITHYKKMSKLGPLPHGELFLIVVPHIPNYNLVNDALSVYRKSITTLAQEACTKLAQSGFFIVGVQDYRIQDLQGGGLLVPLSLLVFEDIERMLKSEPQQKLKLKEMVICVPDGFQCQRAKEISALPVEPSILDIPPGDPFPNLPLVHATYIIYIKL